MERHAYSRFLTSNERRSVPCSRGTAVVVVAGSRQGFSIFALAKMICICIYLVALLQQDETRTERSGRRSLAPAKVSPPGPLSLSPRLVPGLSPPKPHPLGQPNLHLPRRVRP